MCDVYKRQLGRKSMGSWGGGGQRGRGAEGVFTHLTSVESVVEVESYRCKSGGITFEQTGRHSNEFSKLSNFPHPTTIPILSSYK
jgi:hypothetical protein